MPHPEETRGVVADVFQRLGLDPTPPPADAAAPLAYTVATLPAAPPRGTRAYVTNALAPAYLAAVAGGGAVVAPVFFNGTTWVCA